jgi:signal peptidase I
LAAIHDDPDYDPAGEPVEPGKPVDGSEVRPTVAWDDLATATPLTGTAAATAAPEPAASSEPLAPPAAPSSAPLVPPAKQAAGPANEATARRRPRPRPYAGAPVHYLDEPLPEADPERTVETSRSAGAAPARELGAAARSRSEEPAGQEKLEKGGPVRGRRTARWLIRTAVLLAIAVVTALLLRAYVVSPYYIPSASMEPTLHGCSGCNNDHVLVDKLSYRMHDVHRGDVVVFHRPDTWPVPEKTLIKRVVGLPGDRLAVRDGKVYVNGLQLQESYLNAACPPMTSLSEDPGSPVRTYGPVPPGELYVMGDNRCDSADSRAFGPVPTADVIGRAFVIIWPLGRVHWL